MIICRLATMLFINVLLVIRVKIEITLSFYNVMFIVYKINMSRHKRSPSMWHLGPAKH